MPRRRFWVDIIPGDGAINRKAKLLKIAGRYQVGAEAKYKRYKRDIAKAASRMKPVDGFVRASFIFHAKTRSGLVCLPDEKVVKIEAKDIKKTDCAYTSLMDVDAPTKATLDGLADGGLFRDDVVVVELELRKRVAAHRAEGVSIEVSTLDYGTLGSYPHGVDRLRAYDELKPHLPAIAFVDVDFATVGELESALEWARDPEQDVNDCPMWCTQYLEGAPECDA